MADQTVPPGPGVAEYAELLRRAQSTAEAAALLRAADALGEAVNALWRQHRDLLQRCADLTGRPMHQAIPGLPPIQPTRRKETPDAR